MFKFRHHKKTKAMSVFQIFGYHKDYWINGKYAGHILMTEPDRDVHGYSGRITEVLTQPIQLNNKTLQAGVQVTHECIPLCGKIKGATLDERLNVLKEHYQKL